MVNALKTKSKSEFSCKICGDAILEEELQVWLQTKHKEFDKWRFLEDYKFHNSCWVNKMKSIRQRGQDDVKYLIEKGFNNAKKHFNN